MIVNQQQSSQISHVKERRKFDMKNLAELAGQLIDLQERDGFNTKTGHNRIEE